MHIKPLLHTAMLCLAILIMNIVHATEIEQLEKHIERVLSEEQLAGITWSVIDGNQSYVGSTGQANIATQLPMINAQKMHVGSVSKTVLAMGVLRLISTGAITLESEVTPYLSKLQLNNPWSANTPIRVKHLLEHTAGLDNIKMRQFLSTTPTPDMPLEAAFSKNQHDLLTIRTQPGTQYSYSNMGYALLAMIIEAVTQQRYEAYLDSRLLHPLDMHDSTFEFISQSGPRKDPLLAMGYHENAVMQKAVPMYLRAAGQFTTTAPDMTKFMAFILSNGQLKGEAFIQADLMALLAIADNTDAKKAGLPMGHGLAFATRDRHDAVGMCHPGGTFGFKAYICLYPNEKKGFFYSINTDSETANTEQFNALFIQYLKLKSAKLPEPKPELQHNSDVDGFYILAPNNMAEFAFIDKLFNFIWVTASEQHMVINSLQSSPIRLSYIGNNLYQQAGRTQASHVVYAKNDDELFMSNGLKTFKKVPVTTLLPYWVSMVVGIFGLLLFIIIGCVKLFMSHPLKRTHLAFINVLLFSIPVYFYLNQSFLEFGMLNIASMSLILVSTILPITLGYSVFHQFAKIRQNRWEVIELIAIISALQFCLIVIWWEQYPLIFWR
ncbi:serine hydrolase domain-containing protein [Pseudoalteromonas sp. MMG005]|uniref:serine hydrolase domain-containing protein n=1 Tax=Pseudoalteromonas sp. MMG005 TaxID=2822682 RepID=UPI001B3A46C2|nr:serine hydrolase domain-containing protein [Pseudoalteromonas sp. MMG005]MBQ4847446.1 beta-lactamase family protein [Pseudoalteromonas sp. MMG005]